MPGVAIFTLLHKAEFYINLHQQAADLLPMGENKTWLDVGCGPGVLARIAARKGYAVRGIDIADDMIAAAQEKREGLDIAFGSGDLGAEVGRGKTYDVVSASSLLVVLPDAAEGLVQLRRLVKPGGHLLLIEASPQMNRARAWAAFLSWKLGKHGYMLLPWSMGRSGHALPDDLFTTQPGLAAQKPLLSDMANAWLLQV
jgi:2-polyprenyl-3-methyl-5-hydroxy-6-metoxy-1,4-benzoquinol methylase